MAAYNVHTKRDIRTRMHMHTHTHTPPGPQFRACYSICICPRTQAHTHRASVQSRLFEAEEDADNNKALVVQLKGEIKELKQKLVRADNTRRKLHNELQELKGNIRVFARVRPSDERCVLGIDEEIGSVTVPYNGNHSEFRFDRAFNPRSTQVSLSLPPSLSPFLAHYLNAPSTPAPPRSLPPSLPPSLSLFLTI